MPTDRNPSRSAAGRTMRRTIAVVLLLGILPLPARAQLQRLPGRANVDRLNRRLVGCVVDLTDNHGADRRIYSPILGMPRDLYVYLPPGFDPTRRYPLVVFLHMAAFDERAFVDKQAIHDLDDLIVRGEVPPMVVASPDGNYGPDDRGRQVHSFYLNGRGGRFEDHLLEEVIPFVESHYAIAPGRGSHAIVGISAGGLGAMSLAIRHRDRFGAVATIGAPLNLRYGNVDGDFMEDFDPTRYRWRTRYDPDEILARFYGGLVKVRAGPMITPVFGDDAGTMARITEINPADLIFTTDLRPGELPMYVNYPGRGEFHFDAHAESFAWLAASRGIPLTLVKDPEGRHGPRYFRRNLPDAIRWIGAHLATCPGG